MREFARDIVDLLESKYQEYNTPDFIQPDPISVPHRFSKKQDKEIAGFFAAILAWGLRKTIIAKCTELMQLMDNAPHDFVCHAGDSDLKRILTFKHRTFNTTDLLYFVDFFRHHYSQYDSLEDAFLVQNEESQNIKQNLIGFKEYVSSLEHFPKRSGKHVSTPTKNSACKRLNMYLRWMVRKDDRGVDFGIWTRLKSSQLVIPCDVHVQKSVEKLGLMPSSKVNWNYAAELTEKLKFLDPNDPAKYDFALFGMSMEKYFER
ncbi:MAG: TIGR02757 family protein [Leadbetterella sp.]